MLASDREHLELDAIVDRMEEGALDGGDARYRVVRVTAMGKVGSRIRHTVRLPTSPSTSFMLTGSMGTCPEQKTKPFATIAWLSKDIGLGALSVRMTCLGIVAWLRAE
jgi:hypothetical protein